MTIYSGYDINNIVRNPDFKQLLKDIMDVSTGHDHDGTNTKAVSVGTPSDLSVTTAKLAANAVTTAKITDANVTTAKLATGAVTANELGADAVTTTKILDANVTLGKLSAGVQTSLGLADTALQALQLTTLTPVNAVAATGTLTISGVVIDGETVSISSNIYEFAADTAQTVSGGNFAVNIEASATKAAGTLTIDTQPTSGDTMVIGAKTYTFVPDGTANANGEVSRGVSLATAKTNIVAAINGTDSVNTANASASAAAFVGNDSVITALIGGTAGNSIVTTETFTAGTNVFDAATLGTTTAGVNCSAANAVTALVASITANDTVGVGGADGAGDTVVLTADTKGTAANSITTTETMANGSFGGATLSGGVAGTVGDQWDLFVDASYLYVAIAANTATSANWRRISLGSVY